MTDDFIKYARPLIGDNWVSVPLIDGRLQLAQLNTSKGYVRQPEA
ncbi:MAG: hypothetical protein R3C02_05620 [Planctomycetaceae bacterium]